MAEVDNEVWALLGKYLFDEASPSECLLVESLLNENANLKNYYQQLQTVFLINENSGGQNAMDAFVKLDRRIKSQTSK